MNYDHLQTNPIYLELKQYESIKVSNSNLITAYQKIKPKVIITDYLSTPVYELANSASDIILFLDKYNYPKKNVLKSLNKRCFIVKNIKQMNICLNLIFKNKKTKKYNREFYDQFYKEKEVIS